MFSRNGEGVWRVVHLMTQLWGPKQYQGRMVAREDGE